MPSHCPCDCAGGPAASPVHCAAKAGRGSALLLSPVSGSRREETAPRTDRPYLVRGPPGPPCRRAAHAKHRDEHAWSLGLRRKTPLRTTPLETPWLRNLQGSHVPQKYQMRKPGSPSGGTRPSRSPPSFAEKCRASSPSASRSPGDPPPHRESDLWDAPPAAPPSRPGGLAPKRAGPALSIPVLPCQREGERQRAAAFLQIGACGDFQVAGRILQTRSPRLSIDGSVF